jgi:hypothetical protein
VSRCSLGQRDPALAECNGRGERDRYVQPTPYKHEVQVLLFPGGVVTEKSYIQM